MYKPNLVRFAVERYGEFESLGGIGSCDTDMEHVQDFKMYFTIEKWCSMNCQNRKLQLMFESYSYSNVMPFL